MAKYIKTPPINLKHTRKIHDKETGITSIEESLESRLLKGLDNMLSHDVPVTKTRLANETGIKGGSYKTYSAIFDDTIDMFRMFVLGTKEKTGELAAVPNFDKLEQEAATLIQQHASRIDYLGNLYIEMNELNPEIDINDTLDRLYDILDAYWGFKYTTSIQLKVNQDNMNNIVVPDIPTKLIEKINAKLDSIDKEIINLEQQNEELSKCRDFLLPQLMIGKIK